jgi:broad specificity phosphatase PhoE
MQSELILLCHAATRAMKTGFFPAGDDPLDETDRPHRSSLGQHFKVARVVASPARAARDTASEIRSECHADEDWSDLDYGRWRGRAIRDIHDEDPGGLGAWLSDPASAPHGGESLVALQARIRGALIRPAQEGTTLIVTHAIVVKVALSIVLDAPLDAVYSMDLEPLSSITLTRSGDAWRLRCKPCV